VGVGGGIGGGSLGNLEGVVLVIDVVHSEGSGSSS